jgi:hypothetical protein
MALESNLRLGSRSSQRSTSGPGIIGFGLGGRWALTACNGDPAESASWRREILTVCLRWFGGALDKAGSEGVRLKTTGERWYGGHAVRRIAWQWTPSERI